MKQKDFFQQLKDELHGHPFRDRFLDELKAHSEDLEVEKLSEENWRKRMGEVEKVSNNFLNIMNPLRKLFFVLEALFYGFLTAPAALIFFTVNKWQQIDPSINQSRFVIGMIISAIFITLIFYFAFKRYQLIKSDTGLGPKLWSFLIFIPGLISLSFLSFFGFSEKDVYRIETTEALTMIGIFLLINLAATFLGWFSRRNQKANDQKKRRVLDFLKKALLIYLATGIILKTIFIYFIHGEPSAGMMIMMAPFLPIMSIEYMFVFFWTGMMNFSTENVNLFTTYYFLIFILIFLGLQSMWVIFKEKKWLSFRTLIVLYVLTLFLIPCEFGTKEPEFKIPVVNFSEQIEKKELGIFYGIIKYFNQDEGLVFKYEVGFEPFDSSKNAKGDFIIKSNTGKIIYLPYPENLENYELIFDTKITGSNKEIPPGINFPDFYDCDQRDINNCNINDFAQKYLLKNGGVLVSDAVFSEDGKWGLISMPSAPYDPDNLYLIQLKK